MMRRLKTVLICAWACLMLCAAAHAQETITLSGARARLALPDGWTCLTAEEATGALRASMDACSALCEITAPGGQIRLIADAREAEEAFALSAVKSQSQGIGQTVLSLTAARGGTALTFEMRVIAREADAQDEALLREAASRLVYMGEEADEQAAQLQRLTPAESAAPADITVQRDDVPLTLEDIPSQTPNGRLTLSGRTAPGASMRYYLNGTGYERFTADENGDFSARVTLYKEGTHSIVLQSISKDARSSYQFKVRYEREPSELLVKAPALCYTERVILRGAVYPGVEVACETGGRTFEAVVTEDGLFTCEVSLRRAGSHDIRVTASGGGYQKTTQTVTVERSELVGEAITLSVTALANDGALPCLLGTANGRAVAVYTSNLWPYAPGDSVQITVAFTGEARDIAAPGLATQRVWTAQQLPDGE